ncbi:MAG: hypothetical protein IK086_03460 [Clostridia bacterium]|nr:hypothetical protein [Clostridia bacterium]
MQEISLYVIFKIARKRILPLIITFILAAVITFSYCSFIATPVYGATASIIVTNGAVVAADSATATSSGDKVLSSDIQASLALADTVVDILCTDDLYQAVADKLGKEDKAEYDYKDLKSQTTVVRRGDDTLFIDVTYKNTDPYKAMKIANTFAEESCYYVKDFISKSNPKVVSKAHKSSLVYPRTFRATVLVSLGATFVLFVVLIFIELLNNTVKGEEDFTSRYTIPVLGTIPDFDEARKVSAYKKGGYYK